MCSYHHYDDGPPVWANAHVPPVGPRFTEGAREEWSVPDHSIQVISVQREYGKTQMKRSAVQMEFCQIAFQANGRFVGTICSENQSIF